MKTIVYFISGLMLSNLSVAAESGKCSPENLEKLLNLSTKIIGELGSSSIATTKLFAGSEFDKMSSKELKNKFLKIKEEQNKKTMPAIEEISSFVKSHPECDKDRKFSLKAD